MFQEEENYQRRLLRKTKYFDLYKYQRFLLMPNQEVNNRIYNE